MAKRLALYGTHVSSCIHLMVSTVANPFTFTATAGAAGPTRPRPRETAQLRELKTAALSSASKGAAQLSRSKGVSRPRKINGVVQPRGIARLAQFSVRVQAHPTAAGILTTQSAAL